MKIGNIRIEYENTLRERKNKHGEDLGKSIGLLPAIDVTWNKGTFSILFSCLHVVIYICFENPRYIHEDKNGQPIPMNE